MGLALFAGVLLILAASGLLSLLRRDTDPVLLSYHLCLIAFIATFLGDNGLLDYPTNFLLFFVIFANQYLLEPAASLYNEVNVKQIYGLKPL